MACSSASVAQSLPDPTTFRYRVVFIPHSAVDGCSDRAEMVGLGLNDCAEVTGFVVFDHTSCDGHPFYYSYLGNAHGIPAQTTRDLAVLAGQPTWFGKAHEINNAGDIVGTLGSNPLDLSTGFATNPAYFWRMSSYAAPPVDALSTRFALGTQPIGEAFGINNDADPLMVGSTDTPPSSSYAAFRSRVSASGVITALPLAPGDSKSFAFDVSTPNAGAPLAAGGSIGTSQFPNPPCGQLHVDEAITWTIGSTTTVSPLVEEVANPSNMTYWQAVANAVNADGDTAGWRRQNSECRQRALVWIGGTPIELGFVPPIPLNSDTEVRGMTAVDPGGAIMLVGSDNFNAEGYIWWRPSSSGSFAAIPASGLCLALPPGFAFQNIFELNDVNRWGWIVGSARMNAAPFREAILLIPDHCPTDLDWSGLTDATDLSILLGAWGACPGTTSCVADLDCNNIVGPADLAILLGAWNTVCTYFEDLDCPSEVPSLRESFAGEGQQLSVVATAFGFGTAEDFTTWIASLDEAKALEVGTTIQAILSSGGADQ